MFQRVPSTSSMITRIDSNLCERCRSSNCEEIIDWRHMRSTTTHIQPVKLRKPVTCFSLFLIDIDSGEFIVLAQMDESARTTWSLRLSCVSLVHSCRGWSGGAMVLGELPVPGRRIIWTTALAVGAGGVVWTFLLSSILSFLFLPLFWRRPETEILSQRAVKPKTTNQPIIHADMYLFK